MSKEPGPVIDIEAAFDPFVSIDAEGRILMWNHRAEQTFGWERKEAIGKKLSETIIPPQHREAYEKGLKHYLATGKGPVLNKRIEITALHRDGHEFPVELIVWPVKIDGIYQFNAFVRDLTERKRSEEEIKRARESLETHVAERTKDLQEQKSAALNILQDIAEARKRAETSELATKSKAEELASSNKELEQFAYAVSHDLKAPLRGIDSLAGWLAEDYQDKLDQEGKKQLGLLKERVQRMYSLIDGILEYSRIGRIQGEPVAIDLNILLKEVTELIQVPAKIHILVKKGLPVIHAEKTRIHQLFQNLLSNAIKFMDKPKGKIEVGFTEDGHFWRFSVRDNGPGIDEKYFEKIFQLFQTLGMKENEEGTGVGLTLVKRIVETYGGRIWVESKVGEGTTFYFTLPK